MIFSGYFCCNSKPLLQGTLLYMFFVKKMENPEKTYTEAQESNLGPFCCEAVSSATAVLHSPASKLLSEDAMSSIQWCPECDDAVSCPWC